MIKICGLHKTEDVILAENLGADVLGMIYGVPESPRNNTLEELRLLFKSVKTAKIAILFRNSKLEFVIEALKEIQPSIVHFCGVEDLEYRNVIKKEFPHLKIWQSYGVPVDQDYQTQFTEDILALLNDTSVDQVVLDAKKSGKTGGTGKLLPLNELNKSLNEKMNQLVIAGGLSPINVEEVLQTLKPLGVDVSSGIESIPGKKDPVKLEKFYKLSKGLLKRS